MSYSKKINLVVLQNAINISWRNPRKWQWRCRAWNIHKVKRSTWYYAHDIITQAALNTPVQLRNYRFYCTYCMYISLNVNSRPIKHTRKQQNSKLVLQPLLNVTHVSQHTTDQKNQSFTVTTISLLYFIILLHLLQTTATSVIRCTARFCNLHKLSPSRCTNNT